MLDQTIPPWITRIARDAAVTEPVFRRAYTLERIRSFMETHLGAHNKDVADGLSLSIRTVATHVAHLRSEWKR